MTDLSPEDWLHALEGQATGSLEDAEGLRLDMRQALERLEPGQRRALELRYLQGLDGADLARALGVSPGAARVRVTRALQALRAQFGPSDAEVMP